MVVGPDAGDGEHLRPEGIGVGAAAGVELDLVQRAVEEAGDLVGD